SASPVPANPNDPAAGITEVGTADARTLNPILIADPTSLALSRLFFSGLVTINPKDGTATPDLAEAWTVSDDGLTYTFTLRPKVQWSDNQALTADDITYSYNLYLNRDANSPRYNTVYAIVESVTTIDDRTVRFKLRLPTASFLTDVATFGIVPQHSLVNTQPADLATSDFGTTSNIVGTGPFRMVRWLRSERIEADANPNYQLGPVAAPHYTYIVLPTDDAVRDALATGKADFGVVSPAVQKGLANTPGVKLTTYDTYDMTYVGLQLDAAKPASKFFGDVNVRKALMLALDRNAMLQSARDGVGIVADGVQPPPSWAYAPVDPHYRQNVDEAKRLLDAAGWKVGADGVRAKYDQPFSFTLATNSSDPIRETYAGLLRDAWANIGVNVTIVSEKWSMFVDRVTRTHDFDAFVASFAGNVDPDLSTLFSIDAAKTGLNAGRYFNTDVDNMLRQARGIYKPEQQTARKDLYTKIQQQIMTDLPILPLDFSKNTVAVRARVTGFDASANDLGLRFRALAYTWNVG
ncbi:MAG: ABC transporter substrate-binding protein, partial [Chloroflexota bacterium]|nr:ABC transporter substrate-binding protein [Chloroflexota bacterium]